MLMKVTLLALLGGVAVAEVSNYEPVHSPYTSKNDPVQHYFGARQDGILDYGPYLASVGMVSPLICLIHFNNNHCSSSILCLNFANPHVHFCRVA